MKVKLLIVSSVAKPGSVGAVLGVSGLNSQEFCKRFNHLSSKVLLLKDNFKMPVKLEIDENGDYSIEIGAPQTASLLALSAKFFCRQTVYEIANLCLLFEYKKNKIQIDDRQYRLQQLCKQIIGSARSMGMLL